MVMFMGPVWERVEGVEDRVVEDRVVEDRVVEGGG